MKVHIINSAKNIQRVINEGGDWETSTIHLNSGSIISAQHVSESHEENSVNIHLKDGSVLVEVPANVIKTDKELTSEILPKGFEAASLDSPTPEYKARRCCGG